MVAPESCPGLLSSLQSSPPFLLNITAQEDSVMAWEPTYLLSPVLLLLLASEVASSVQRSAGSQRARARSSE